MGERKKRMSYQDVIRGFYRRVFYGLGGGAAEHNQLGNSGTVTGRTTGQSANRSNTPQTEESSHTHSISAQLSPGEFYISERAVERYGEQLISNLNAPPSQNIEQHIRSEMSRRIAEDLDDLILTGSITQRSPTLGESLTEVNRQVRGLGQAIRESAVSAAEASAAFQAVGRAIGAITPTAIENIQMRQELIHPMMDSLVTQDPMLRENVREIIVDRDIRTREVIVAFVRSDPAFTYVARLSYEMIEHLSLETNEWMQWINPMVEAAYLRDVQGNPMRNYRETEVTQDMPLHSEMMMDGTRAMRPIATIVREAVPFNSRDGRGGVMGTSDGQPLRAPDEKHGPQHLELDGRRIAIKRKIVIQHTTLLANNTTKRVIRLQSIANEAGLD